MARESKIDESLVRHVAHLSRLALTDDEITRMTGELSAIVGYIDQLGELDTADVPPTAHALPVHNVFREDEVTPSFDSDTALSNAPQREGTFFRVPKILDTGDGA
ncbi:MAG: Asp-tRNA(Asn)/Glu-tRNA(Gln) amidotransferase subunit GatC [Phycisphaerales bacterium]|nr:Asp-tRNA(Asn)/Glu-tRNA(Gln) amidotransferase subunit GatC [Phycisphaerales bacterium]